MRRREVARHYRQLQPATEVLLARPHPTGIAGISTKTFVSVPRHQALIIYELSVERARKETKGLASRINSRSL